MTHSEEHKGQKKINKLQSVRRARRGTFFKESLLKLTPPFILSPLIVKRIECVLRTPRTVEGIAYKWWLTTQEGVFRSVLVVVF
jgi:hypothetical protein